MFFFVTITVHLASCGARVGEAPDVSTSLDDQPYHVHPGERIAIVQLNTSPWKRDVTTSRDATRAREVVDSRAVDRGVAWQRSSRQRTHRHGGSIAQECHEVT